MRTFRLLLLALILVGCVPAVQQARFDALQNPTYRGDANKKLVPFQARQRDAAACARFALAQTEDDPVEASWREFFDCMRTRGWR